MKRQRKIFTQSTASTTRRMGVEDLKKHFLSAKWQSVMTVVTQKAYLLTYLSVIKKLVRVLFADKPVYLREQDGILVVAVKASDLDFEARCHKTETLLKRFQENVPDEIAMHVGVSVI